MMNAHTLAVSAATFVAIGLVGIEPALSQESGETFLQTQVAVDRAAPISRPLFRPKRKVFSRRQSGKAAKLARRAPAVAPRPATMPIPKPSPRANPAPDAPADRIAVVHDELFAKPMAGETRLPNAVNTFRLTHMEPVMPDVSPTSTERHTDGRADAHEIGTHSDSGKYAILAIILALICAFLLGTMIGMWSSARWLKSYAGHSLCL